MMTKLEQAARQALEALETHVPHLYKDRGYEPITALREALDHSSEANEMVQELFDMDDHPPHRLCECRKCMEYFTPLPDCDAFAGGGKPIAEQEPIRFVWNGEGWVEADEYAWETTDDTERRILFAAPQPVQSLTAQDLNDLEIETKWAGDSHEFERIVNAAVAKLKPVRTKDPCNPLQDLTDDEIELALDAAKVPELPDGYKNVDIEIARAAIAADREKNK